MTVSQERMQIAIELSHAVLIHCKACETKYYHKEMVIERLAKQMLAAYGIKINETMETK